MGRRVLVVEDEGLIAMLIESQFEDLGHEVIGTAARLREALDLARTLDLDLAVLDVNLAGELSYPVAECLARARRAVLLHHRLRFGRTAGRTRRCGGAAEALRPGSAGEIDLTNNSVAAD